MAGHIVSKRNRSVRAVQTGPRRRAVGVTGGVAAFLALGLSPLAVAPSASADPLTDVLDLIIEPAIAASSGISPAEFFDPGVLGAALSELATPAGWETLATDLSSFASGSAAVSDSGATAAASDPTSGLEAFEQQWIDSSSGQSIDASLNSLFRDLDPSSDACGFICNGAEGTVGSSLAAADGQDGGVWFGDGGNGVTDLAGQGGVGGSAGEFGDGGAGGNGVDGEAGGAGGAGGFLAGDGGAGGDGGDGLAGVNGGDGGAGGAGGNGGLLGVGGSGGAGGSAIDGTAGGVGSVASGSIGGAGGAGGVIGGGGGTGPVGGGGPLSVIGTVNVGSGPGGVAVSPIGPEAGDVYTLTYVETNTGEELGTVSVVNPATNAIVATIPVGEGGGIGPDEIAVSPTGPEAGDVYVANPGSGTVSVISPATNTIVDTITTHYGAEGLAVSPTGPEAGDLYVTSYYTDQVFVIDPHSNAIVDTVNVGTCDECLMSNPTSVAVSPAGPDAGDIYVVDEDTTSVSVINPTTNSVTATIPLSIGNLNYAGLAVSPTGTEAGDIYVVGGDDAEVAVINPGTNTVVDTIDAGVAGDSYPDDVAVGATGAYAGDLYVTEYDWYSADGSGQLIVINPETNTVVDTVNIPGTSELYTTESNGVAISPTGSEAGDAYVTNKGNGTLSVIG
jgi:YVTN family beta-propeller protein